MSWLQKAADEPTPLEGVLRLRPELLALYRDFYGALWDHALAPANLLELCRLRTAQIHGCDAEWAVRHAQAGVTDRQLRGLEDWRTAACFSPAERAALACAEKMPWQHHGITDADVQALRVHLADGEVVALLLALTLFDAQCRVRLVLGVAPFAATVDAPASAAGPLY
jgi:alkylhydroperoxidase family enzyme